MARQRAVLLACLLVMAGVVVGVAQAAQLGVVRLLSAPMAVSFARAISASEAQADEPAAAA
jgi:uncharacterized protein HemY